jgi:hypothetical protein
LRGQLRLSHYFSVGPECVVQEITRLWGVDTHHTRSQAFEGWQVGDEGGVLEMLIPRETNVA